MSRAFLRLVGPDREATIVNVSSWGMLAVRPEGSSYFISKLALARLSEAIPCAYPKVTSIVYHPAMTDSEMGQSHPEVLHFSKDTGMSIRLSSCNLLSLPHFYEIKDEADLSLKLNSLGPLPCTWLRHRRDS